MNLLPEQARRNLQQVYTVRLLSVLFGLSALVLVIVLVAHSPSLVLLQSETMSLQRQLAAAEAALEEQGGSETQQYLTNAREQLQFAQQVLDKRTPSELIALFEEAGSDAIRLRQIDVQGIDSTPQVVLRGDAATRADLVFFRDALRAVEEIASVDLPNRDLASDIDAPFTLTIVFK